MRLLIIEDDRHLADSMSKMLTGKGFEVNCVYSGGEAEVNVATGVYDFLIMNVTLPECDGLALMRRARKLHRATPIIAISTRPCAEDEVEALNAGADYFLAKPFENRMMLAYVNALVRRYGAKEETLSKGDTYLVLCDATLHYRDNSVRVSAKECEVMRLLLSYGDGIIPKEVILSRIWGLDTSAVENHVEVYIGMLRKKLAAVGSDLRIVAARRLGYRVFIQE